MKNVLLVQDAPPIIKDLDLHLNSINCTVEKVQDGIVGLRTAQKLAFDLIILDLKLPNLDGLEFCKQLRGASNSTPIIMLSDRCEEIDKVLGFEMIITLPSLLVYLKSTQESKPFSGGLT